MARYATTPMLTELRRAGVTLDMTFQGEELDNYIVHMYNLFMLPAPWQSAAETAECVYRLRKGRNQVWNTPWRAR